MKNISVIIVLIFGSIQLSAQNVGIGTNKPLSKLHVAGDLRVDSLASKDSGVVIHNMGGVLTSVKFTGKKSDVLRGDGTFQSLQAVAASSPYWLTTGNSGIDAANNFLGTTDNKPLIFKVNNEKAGALEPSTGNISLGINSLLADNTGSNNIAVGVGALQHSSRGSNSIAIGDSALHYLDTLRPEDKEGFLGDYNLESIAIGKKALFNNYGNGNTAIGLYALMENGINWWNTAIGYNTLMHNSALGASENTAVGTYSLFNNGDAFTYWGGPTYGAGNTAMGSHSLYSNVYGNYNVAIGSNALYENTNGSDNVAIGYRSLRNNQSGSNNTAVGSLSLHQNTFGSYNTAIGERSLILNKTGTYNTANGVGSMGNNISGRFNTASGSGSLGSNTTGSSNSAFGMSSLGGNMIGINNTATGNESLFLNQTGSGNTATGAQALYSNQSSNQTATGYQSLYSNTTGKFNTASGYRSLYANISGSSNVADGYQALQDNTSGSSNVAIGFQSLFENNTGVSNTAAGTRALVANTTGVNNTAAGYGALLSNTTGFQNTALGMLADVTAANLYNATAIGYNAKVNASNKVRIGNAAVTKIEGQVPFSTPSDHRFKFNVDEDVVGLDFILKLRPVTYQFDITAFDQGKHSTSVHQVSYDRVAAIRRTGFIAQEVEKAADQSHYDFSGINKPESPTDHYSLSYEVFVVPLVKGMQEQQVIIEKLKKLNDDLLKKVIQLDLEINAIKSQMSKQFPKKQSFNSSY